MRGALKPHGCTAVSRARLLRSSWLKPSVAVNSFRSWLPSRRLAEGCGQPARGDDTCAKSCCDLLLIVRGHTERIMEKNGSPENSAEGNLSRISGISWFHSTASVPVLIKAAFRHHRNQRLGFFVLRRNSAAVLTRTAPGFGAGIQPYWHQKLKQS